MAEGFCKRLAFEKSGVAHGKGYVVKAVGKKRMVKFHSMEPEVNWKFMFRVDGYKVYFHYVPYGILSDKEIEETISYIIRPKDQWDKMVWDASRGYGALSNIAERMNNAAQSGYTWVTFEGEQVVTAPASASTEPIWVDTSAFPRRSAAELLADYRRMGVRVVNREDEPEAVWERHQPEPERITEVIRIASADEQPVVTNYYLGVALNRSSSRLYDIVICLMFDHGHHLHAEHQDAVNRWLVFDRPDMLLEQPVAHGLKVLLGQ